MKAKIVQIIFAVFVISGAFLLGNYTKDNWVDSYCKSDLIITDWNTNGEELSMILSDGSEIYAYKKGE